MLVAAKIQLADARAELRVSQDALAKAADLSKGVIVKAEKGQPIQRISAHALLKALNVYRKQAEMSPLSLHDIDWKIVGE